MEWCAGRFSGPILSTRVWLTRSSISCSKTVVVVEKRQVGELGVASVVSASVVARHIEMMVFHAGVCAD
jgi:hypothetical protein